MFFEILRFELRQQLKAPLFWIVAAVFGTLAFALASTDAVIVGGASGNVLRNAPLVIARLLGVLTVLSIFLVTVFVAGAALRDFDSRTAELFFTTPLSRGAYLGGRFAAGYLAALAVMLACALGVAVGGLMPWIDATRLGPASWHGYAWAFGVMVVPDMLFIAALLFLLATTTRSLLATYIGLIVYFVLNSVVGLLTRDVNNHFIAAMLDPFGGRTLALVTRYWSADQANHDLPALTGVLLFNRVLWSAAGVAMLGAAVALFRPNREGLQLPRRRKRAEPPLLRPQAGAATLTLPKVRLADDLRAHLLQLRTQFVFDTLGVLRGVPFLIMLALGLFNLIFALALSSQIYGTATWPVTHQVLENVRGGFQWLLYIIITFYAGELVWRERSQRSAEVSDAFPVPDWVPLTAKLGALVAVIATFLLVGALVGIGWQLGHGYTHLEPGLYLAKGTYKDAKGRSETSSVSLYVTGAGFVMWDSGDTDRVDLTADKKLYDIGDVAHVLVKSPYPDARALVTVERDGVMDKRVVDLHGSAQSLDIPITAEMIPDAFVSVMMVHQRVAKGGHETGRDPNRPGVKVGLVQVSVEKKSKRLEVTLKPEKPTYEPGQDVAVDLNVKDWKGQPVEAQLTVYAVDEAVLRLTGYQVPDPIDAIFPDQGLSARVGERLLRAWKSASSSRSCASICSERCENSARNAGETPSISNNGERSARARTLHRAPVAAAILSATMVS